MPGRNVAGYHQLSGCSRMFDRVPYPLTRGSSFVSFYFILFQFFFFLFLFLASSLFFFLLCTVQRCSVHREFARATVQSYDWLSYVTVWIIVQPRYTRVKLPVIATYENTYAREYVLGYGRSIFTDLEPMAEIDAVSRESKEQSIPR